METIVVSRSEMIYMFGESCPCECLLESMHHYASNLPFIFWVRSKDGLDAISALLKLSLGMAVPQRWGPLVNLVGCVGPGEMKKEKAKDARRVIELCSSRVVSPCNKNDDDDDDGGDDDDDDDDDGDGDFRRSFSDWWNQPRSLHPAHRVPKEARWLWLQGKSSGWKLWESFSGVGMGALKWITHIIRNESKLLVADRCLRWPHCARTVSLAAKGVLFWGFWRWQEQKEKAMQSWRDVSSEILGS